MNAALLKLIDDAIRDLSDARRFADKGFTASAEHHLKNVRRAVGVSLARLERLERAKSQPEHAA